MANILIVDDDLDIIDSLKIILEANGHQVLMKTDTDDLVETVMKTHPDLIILDIIFPENSQAGFTAARSLHKVDRIRDIPILFLSAVNQLSKMSFGFSEDDISEDFMPVKGFLEKPVEPALLIAKVDELLGMRDSAR
ncbi:MAG: two-component system, OmpR family, alkaline phosphatase synthesis response regulator PhoP [Acidobacteria bacterium]|jgi:two-component system sensor histidine kinase/response regulator|nr:two-component system, OmpR family, alkaline phosphatase synthesis response regulator PhoP [Acidobacteriota bacterium]